MAIKTDIKKLNHAFFTHQWQRYQILASNVYIDRSFLECDLFGIRKSGFCDEIEIKRTKADFLADFKKTTTNKWQKDQIMKHDELRAGNLLCNYFSFLIPAELQTKCDIPEYAGLYVFRVQQYLGGGDYYWINEVKAAPRLHSRKVDNSVKYEVGRKMAYKYWYSIKTDR